MRSSGPQYAVPGGIEDKVSRRKSAMAIQSDFERTDALKFATQIRI